MNERYVKIKTWDQIKKEYGLHDSRVMRTGIRFLAEMEEQMPKNRIIKVEDMLWKSSNGTRIINHYMIEQEYPGYTEQEDNLFCGNTLCAQYSVNWSANCRKFSPNCPHNCISYFPEDRELEKPETVTITVKKSDLETLKKYILDAEENK